MPEIEGENLPIPGESHSSSSSPSSPVPGLGAGKQHKQTENLETWNRQAEQDRRETPPSSDSSKSPPKPKATPQSSEDRTVHQASHQDNKENEKGKIPDEPPSGGHGHDHDQTPSHESSSTRGSAGREYDEIGEGEESHEHPDHDGKLHDLMGGAVPGMTGAALHESEHDLEHANPLLDDMDDGSGGPDPTSSRDSAISNSSSSKKGKKKGSGEDDDEDEDDDGRIDEEEEEGSRVGVAFKVIAAVAAASLIFPLLLIMGLTGGASSTGGAAAAAANNCDKYPVNQAAGGITNGNAFEYLDVGPLAPNISIGSLSEKQLRNAREIIREGQATNISRKGIIVALSTAAQESTYQNYANDGTDPRLKPEQKDVSKSLQLPHEAVGRDHGSVGVMQQQYPWWGTLEELMTPHIAAKKFYEKLVAVDGWENMPVTVAAQTVQGSLYPDAYAPWEGMSNQLYDALSPGKPTAGKGEVQANDPPTATTGNLDTPMALGTFQISSPFGARDGTTHFGQDYAAPEGTPIYAAASGTVKSAGSASGFGQWIVLSHNVNGEPLDTVYGHMWEDGLLVKVGDTVSAGQQIAKVGNNGQSSGPHLHFEVHPGGWASGNGKDPVGYLNPPVAADGNHLALGTSAPGNAPQAPAPSTELASTKTNATDPGTDTNWVSPREAFKYLDDSPIAPDAAVADLNPQQLKNAREIILEGQGLKLPEKAILVALTTAYLESVGFKNYANSNVPESLTLPHDAVGSDHDSVGVFQQRVSNPDKWGTIQDMMTPHIAAANFYKKLMETSGWESMSVTEAAQAVQVSAYPDAYAPYESKARQLLTMLGGTGSPSMPNTSAATVPGKCDPDTSPQAQKPGPNGEFKGSGGFAQTVMDAARQWMGKPYQWGGGDQNGPTMGDGSGGSEPGFDCSGLTLYAIAKASNGQIILPHYTQAQQDDSRAKVIPLDQKQPGDLIYFSSGGGDSHHVGIYIGNNQLLHAPQTGDVVKVSDLGGWSGEKMDVRRFG